MSTKRQYAKKNKLKKVSSNGNTNDNIIKINNYNFNESQETDNI